MTFEYFCGILVGHSSFFFITHFEKGLVCVPQLPVAAGRSLPLESVPAMGEGKLTQAQTWLLVPEWGSQSEWRIWRPQNPRAVAYYRPVSLANSSNVSYFKFLYSKQ